MKQEVEILEEEIIGICSKTPYIIGTDKIHGIQNGWHYNNNKALWWETKYKNGQKNGLRKWWYEDGTIEFQQVLKQNLIHGINLEFKYN